MNKNELIVVVGEILFDVFPQYRRLGGAPLNVAFHLAAMNYPVRLVTRIGNDKDGEEILSFMSRKGMDISTVQIDSLKPTGRVEVEFSGEGEPLFSIGKDAAYDRLEFRNSVKELFEKEIRLLYFGTLIQRTQNGFDLIRKMTRASSADTQVFCDLNLRDGCFTREIIEASLRESDIVKLNDGEFETLYSWFGDGMNHKDFEQYLMEFFHIRMLCITQGAEGSRIITSVKEVSEAASEVRNFSDSVGAGDAYSAAVIHGVLRGIPLEQIAREAGSLASRVCTLKGALPEDRLFYHGWGDKK